MKPVKQRTSRSRGQSLAEFAMTLPIFVMLFLSAIDLGRAVFIHNTLGSAAREGARYGITAPGQTAQIQAAARSAIFGLDADLVTVAATCSGACSFGDNVTVKTTYAWQPITPFLPTLTLNGISTMFIE